MTLLGVHRRSGASMHRRARSASLLRCTLALWCTQALWRTRKLRCTWLLVVCTGAAVFTGVVMHGSTVVYTGVVIHAAAAVYTGISVRKRCDAAE
eukprot:7264607-Pyramimonas_sp.AAC.1